LDIVKDNFNDTMRLHGFRINHQLNCDTIEFYNLAKTIAVNSFQNQFSY